MTMFLVYIVDHYYWFTSNLRSNTILKKNHWSPYWTLRGDRCIFWLTAPMAKPIKKERFPRPRATQLCHHRRGRNASSLQKLMKGGQRIASMQPHAYVRVVCGRNIRPSAATTGSKVRRACCRKYVRGWTALMAGVNTYEAIVLSLHLTPWSDFN